jgi:hypothetical protein
VSIGIASLAAALPYVALRMTGAARGSSLLAAAFATLSPWSLWLGAATVPESFTASFTAAAAIALGASAAGASSLTARGGEPVAALTARGSEPSGPSAVARIAFAVGMLAACLSRYETWPVAAVLAIAVAARALRGPAADRAVNVATAGIVAIGPLAWMAWNAHAHGDPLHFFQRVARFKRALGEPSLSAPDALLLYPRLFLLRRPDVALALVTALAAVCALAKSRAAIRARWLVPLACAVAQLTFLAYGELRDGAPAHHAERALLGTFFVTAALAVDVICRAASTSTSERGRRMTLGAAALLAIVWVANGAMGLRDVPGRGAADDRRPQIAAGAALRSEHPSHLELTPCAYEQFALIASFGAPELVTTNPRTNAAVTASCPAVERR